MVEGMSVVVNVMLSLMSVMSPPPSLWAHAGGPDGIPTSLLTNCAEDIAPVLKIIFFTLPLF